MLRQALRREHKVPHEKLQQVDLAQVPCEEDGSTYNDLRVELSLLREQQRIEDERLLRLVTGIGKGRGKSPQFEFAAHTILATGCSARAARDQILVAL